MTAGEHSAIEWLGAVTTVPFLSEKRVVVVRNLLRVGHPNEALKDMPDRLGILPEYSRLVLVADDESVTESQRQTRLDNYRTAWEGEIRKSGGQVQDFKVEGKAAKAQIFREAERHGKKIGDRVAQLLLEMSGGSVSRATGELEKIALFIGDAPEIRESDVMEVAIPSREWNVFKLVDGVLEGNAGLALSQLQTLIGSATKAEGAAMGNIFPNLSKNLRLIWQARMLLDHRATIQSIPDELRAQMAEQPSLAGASEWQQQRALRAARKLQIWQLGECMEIVARTDARIKGLEASFSTVDALERMVLEMVEVVAPAGARR
jgi:DNA polymerase III delta subunit